MTYSDVCSLIDQYEVIPRDHAEAIVEALRRKGHAVVLEDPGDRRFGDPVTTNEVSGLVVAFKSLVERNGGRVVFTNQNLHDAEKILVHVDANEDRMIVEIVEGQPPDVPRFEA